MIRFYLGEEPMLPNVPTYLGAEPDDLAYILEHLEELVVKAVDESGGYGMLIGPASTPAEREEFRQAHRAEPRELHRAADDRALPPPDVRARRLHGCHVDLRPFVLCGADRVRSSPAA